MITRILLFLGLILLLSCSNREVKKDIIILKPQKTDEHVHISKGIWLKIPGIYKKAKSYDGYQALNESSISVKISTNSIADIEASFDKRILKKRKTQLLEARPVQFGNNKDAFFAVAYDEKRRTTRYLLAIHEGGITYQIKGFFFERLRDRYEVMLRKALYSTYIGEIIKDELFQVAQFSDDLIIYTKDGKFPTESPDNAYIEVRILKNVKGVNINNLLTKEDRNITRSNFGSPLIETLENGNMLTYHSKGNGNKAVAKLIEVDNQGSFFILCHAKEKANMSEITQFVDKIFTRRVLLNN